MSMCYTCYGTRAGAGRSRTEFECVLHILGPLLYMRHAFVNLHNLQADLALPSPFAQPEGINQVLPSVTSSFLRPEISQELLPLVD